MKRAPGPYLYFPIEISARELDSRLLLTAVAVDRGFDVVLGQKWLMHDNLSYMRPGVLLAKTLTASDGRFMEIAHRRGYRTASIDEEIPGLIATRQGLRWVMRNAVEAADLIFAAGEDHRDALAARFPGSLERVTISGNPRWDLLRPEFRSTLAAEAERLKQRHGPFFLINTNFGLTNSAKGDTRAIIRSLVRSGRIDLAKAEDKAFVEAARRLEVSNMACIRELLQALPQRFSDHHVVLRPHPGEQLRLWRDFVRPLPRVTVIREGAAAPWILAADALIHTNCTTGVEAFALGKPAICLRPAEPPEMDIYVAPLVNPIARSVEECLESLTRVAAGVPADESQKAEWQRAFDRFIAARSGPLAAERVIAAIAERFFGGNPKAAAGAADPWRPKKGYRGSIRRTRSRLSLMPDLDGAQLKARLQALARCADIEREFAVEPCGDRTFHIHGNAATGRKTLAPTVLALAHRLAKKGRSLKLRRCPA
jgi:surface carbohydrate biosynthesis protein